MIMPAAEEEDMQVKKKCSDKSMAACSMHTKV